MSEDTLIFGYSHGPVNVAIAPSISREVIAPPFWDSEVVPRLKSVEEVLPARFRENLVIPSEYQENFGTPLTFWALLVWILRVALRTDIERCEVALRGLYGRYSGLQPSEYCTTSGDFFGFIHDTTDLDEMYHGLFRLQFPIDVFDAYGRFSTGMQVRLLCLYLPSFNCRSDRFIRPESAIPPCAFDLTDADFVRAVADDLGITSALEERRAL